MLLETLSLLALLQLTTSKSILPCITSRFGYGNITKITSETKEVESRGDQQKTKKAKLIIEMTKSEKFEEHYKKYEEIRAQN